MKRRAAMTLLAVLALALTGAGTVRAADPDTLGARLTTSTEWVEIESRATIPTAVTLRIAEGEFLLDRRAFAMEPGEIVRVGYSGVGTGRVAARMTAVDATGDSGAVELVGWLRYTPAPLPSEPFPIVPVGLAILLLALWAIAGLEVRRYRARQRYMARREVFRRVRGLP